MCSSGRIYRGVRASLIARLDRTPTFEECQAELAALKVAAASPQSPRASTSDTNTLRSEADVAHL
jgi:hypothetical protein